MPSYCSDSSAWDDMKFTHVLIDFDLMTSEMTIPQMSLLDNVIRTTPSRQFMEEIFEQRQEEYVTWKREDWACGDCWQSLIFDTMPIWWAERSSQQICGSDGD
jgi:hypothetical protein